MSFLPKWEILIKEETAIQLASICLCLYQLYVLVNILLTLLLIYQRALGFILPKSRILNLHSVFPLKMCHVSRIDAISFTVCRIFKSQNKKKVATFYQYPNLDC